MIGTISGDIGSGKSYLAVWSMLASARREPERPIASNLPVTDEFRRELGSTVYIQIADEEVPHFWRVTPPGCRIYLDEVHLHFDSRAWADIKKRAPDFWAYVCQIRHHGDELWLITQRISYMEKRLRDLALQHLVCFSSLHAMRRLGMEGLAKVGGRLGLCAEFFVVRSYGVADDIGVGDPDDTRWLMLRRSVYQCYDSFAVAQHGAVERLRGDVAASNAESEEGVDVGRVAVWVRRGLVAAVAAGAVLAGSVL